MMMRARTRARRACTTCVSLLLLLAVAETAETAASTIGGVVFVGGLWDLERGIDGISDSLSLSRCEAAVDRADEIGLKSISFLPTFYWVDEGPIDPPEAFEPTCEGFASSLGGYYCYNRYNSTQVDHFCLIRTSEDINTHTCHEPQARDVRIWTLLFSRCVNRAAERGMDIAVNLRVDDGRSLNGWRNTILFSPTTLYGNFSYETAFVQPLVEVLSTISRDGHVSLTVAGEMGASLVHHADEWLAVIDRVREQIDGARPGAPPVKVGIQLNHNKICGCHSVGFVGSYLEFINSFYSFRPEELGISLPAFINLLRGCDYVGVSAYPAFENPTSIGTCEFEELLDRMNDELFFFNTSILEITMAGTRIQFSEIGVGGGASQDGNTPATSAEEAARRPYWGIQGPPLLNRSNDPFRMDRCNELGVCADENEIREYRRYFYSRLTDYLKGEGNCTYAEYIDEAYIWSTGSWDVLGLYRPDDGWIDPVVVDIIARHNSESIMH